MWQKSILGIKKKKKKDLTGVRVCKLQGHGGRWPLLAVMREECALLATVSYMSETEKDQKVKRWHERGTVRMKEKPANHLKGLWGWHLHIRHLSPLANIPRPQTTLLFIAFYSLLLSHGASRRKIPSVYSWSHSSRLMLEGKYSVWQKLSLWSLWTRSAACHDVRIYSQRSYAVSCQDFY